MWPRVRAFLGQVRHCLGVDRTEEAPDISSGRNLLQETYQEDTPKEESYNEDTYKVDTYWTH